MALSKSGSSPDSGHLFKILSAAFANPESQVNSPSWFASPSPPSFSFNDRCLIRLSKPRALASSSAEKSFVIVDELEAWPGQWIFGFDKLVGGVKLLWAVFFEQNREKNGIAYLVYRDGKGLTSKNCVENIPPGTTWLYVVFSISK